MKYRFLLIVALVAVSLATFLARQSKAARRIRDEWPVMGTVAGLTFRGEAPNRDEIRKLVQTRYERMDELLSAWDPDSELNVLSKSGNPNWVDCVSSDVEPCYRAALLLAERSGRAFNPWVGTKLQELGFSHGRPYAAFDLGAIAKGFAVDDVWQKIEELKSVPEALIDLGGNLRVISGSWRTGVRNPFGSGYAAMVVLTNGEAVATSGNYERFIERDGVRYSHILDGRTGEPVSGMAGVTVIAPSAMLADGLSTTLFVLGPAKGIRFVEKWYPDIHVLWIPDTPDKPEIVATRKMAVRLFGTMFPVRIAGM